jgi:formylglycine-generating enzyme required for sulfatase activity
VEHPKLNRFPNAVWEPKLFIQLSTYGGTCKLMKRHTTGLAHLLILLTFFIFPVFAEESVDFFAESDYCDILAEYPKVLKESTDDTGLLSFEKVKEKLGQLKGEIRTMPSKLQKSPLYQKRKAQYKADRKLLKKPENWKNWQEQVSQKLRECNFYGRQILSSYLGSYALLIGESNYTNGWDDLESIPSELDKVEEVLISQGFRVEKSLNLNAKELKKRFETFINQYGWDENNRLLFFYSGHGHTRKGKGYIVPTDAPNPNFNKRGFLRKAVGMKQILTWAERIEAKHVLFLFDSCFSGTVFKARALPEMPRQIMEMAQLPVRQFITAGSANETVPAQSVFASVFVDALRYGLGDLYKDGYVTGEELGLYLKNKVPQYGSQNPQFGKIRKYELSRGDFVFQVQKVPVSSSKSDSDGDGVTDDQKVFRDRLKDDSKGPEMVVIPAGRFRMGDIQGGGENKEKPVHSVSVSRFAMGRYEVTVKEFRRFVNATRYKTDAEKGDGCYVYEGSWNKRKEVNWRNPNFPQNDNQPVVCVSWNDATAYTEWLSEQTGEQYRLPTEAEWEYAARAGTQTKYWWGNEIGENRANCDNDYCGDNFEYTSPVGYFSENPYGLYDTVGNVWEWVFDSWHKNYTNAPNDGKIWAEGADNSYRVLRGGSWYFDSNLTRAAFRYGYYPVFRDSFIGFRVVCRVART